MGRLSGRVAIVTGGASGIGEAAVRLFISEGAKVVLADILEERGQKISKSLGNECLFKYTNVCEEKDVRESVAAALEAYGQLDVMYNNAGIAGAVGSIGEVSVEYFDRTTAVILRGTFLGIKHASAVMKKQGSGSIINTGSTAAVSSGYGNHIYSASKAGVVQLTRTVATELGESGVRVNCISPGFVPTPLIGMARGFSREQSEQRMSVIRDAFKEAQPLLGPIEPEDIARAALFLASDDSRYVNGHNLIVDGGVTTGRMWRDYQKATASLKSALENVDK